MIHSTKQRASRSYVQNNYKCFPGVIQVSFNQVKDRF